MKRSEMLKVIEEVMDYYIKQGKQAWYISPRLLDKLEGKGMAPPEIVNPRYPKSSFVAQYDQVPYKVREWEDEKEA